MTNFRKKLDNKYQNIYIEAELESPEHLDQTTFETLQHKKLCFQSCYLKNVKCKTPNQIQAHHVIIFLVTCPPPPRMHDACTFKK